MIKEKRDAHEIGAETYLSKWFADLLHLSSMVHYNMFWVNYGTALSISSPVSVSWLVVQPQEQEHSHRGSKMKNIAVWENAGISAIQVLQPGVKTI